MFSVNSCDHTDKYQYTVRILLDLPHTQDSEAPEQSRIADRATARIVDTPGFGAAGACRDT
ncbi:hypothetical protein ATOBIA_N14600 [Atopobiaceae bacterium P1]|uniref:Uncharacterized protein n=1 Tax=Leptogranulimonas caecicola TaxID=2894156 RepID=A0AAU9CH39_9ACTN|nr:hypothetical protein ATOBIA_N14600 [Atopobiaceae bacterium P1]BDC91557.1 hypothetical protein ATTO_14290 [Leptogranulimonas caecicola]